MELYELFVFFNLFHFSVKNGVISIRIYSQSHSPRYYNVALSPLVPHRSTNGVRVYVILSIALRVQQPQPIGLKLHCFS